MKNELAFRKKLCEEMHKRNFLTWKIESGSTAIGIPDLHWLQQIGISGWVELKLSREEPKRATYERGQAQWLKTYASSGGIAWTAIYIESLHAVMLVPGRESLIAEKDLSKCMDARLIPLRMEKAWAMIITTIIRI